MTDTTSQEQKEQLHDLPSADTQTELEDGRRHQGHRRTSTSTSSSDSSSEYDGEDKSEHDGHRPSNREVYRSISRSRSRGAYSIRNGAAGTSTGISQPLSRTMSRRDTALSKIRSRPNVAPFSHPLAHIPTTVEALVDFDGSDDPYRPMNWPTKKKVLTTMMYGLTTMSATWASSSYSAGTQQIAEEFHVGSQVAVLGTTLFLFGFGLGPLLWAPLSEVFGRRIAVLTPMFIAMCFSFATAVSKDLQSIMITRFFSAFFASAPVTNTGGVLGDLYAPTTRGLAMAGYGTSSFLTTYSLYTNNTQQQWRS